MQISLYNIPQNYKSSNVYTFAHLFIILIVEFRFWLKCCLFCRIFIKIDDFFASSVPLLCAVLTIDECFFCLFVCAKYSNLLPCFPVFCCFSTLNSAPINCDGKSQELWPLNGYSLGPCFWTNLYRWEGMLMRKGRKGWRWEIEFDGKVAGGINWVGQLFISMQRCCRIVMCGKERSGGKMANDNGRGYGDELPHIALGIVCFRHEFSQQKLEGILPINA